MNNYRKFYLCAGHRGEGTGAVTKYGDEGAEAIDFRTDLADLLRYVLPNNKILEDDDYDNLSKTISKVNSQYTKGMIAVDWHFNSSLNPHASGVEVFIHPNTSETNKEFVADIVAAISDVLSIKNRGVKFTNQSQHNRLAFIEDVNCSSSIVEICFINNERNMNQYKQYRCVLLDRISTIFEEYAII